MAASNSSVLDMLSQGRKFLAALLAVALTAGAIRVAGFGTFDDFQQRVGAVILAAMIVV